MLPSLRSIDNDVIYYVRKQLPDLDEKAIEANGDAFTDLLSDRWLRSHPAALNSFPR